MLDKRIFPYLRCLSEKRTPDESARRRYPPEVDEDTRIIVLDEDQFAHDALLKIIPSKAFRRLSSKTQVLTGNKNAYVRDRLSHTHEVANNSNTIARILGLNENLCYAIALGHDIGHVPFGHAGERFISNIIGKEFRHEVFGVVVAQQIERRGKGLNLTWQVLQGILNHSRGKESIERTENIFEEANVVMYADKTYIWADINDIFERTKTLDYRDFPDIKKLADIFGENHRERTATYIESLCRESAQKGYVSFQKSKKAKTFFELKNLMYKVYNLVNLQNSNEILERVYGFLSKTELIEGIDPVLVLALMTDDDVLSLCGKICINTRDFSDCSVAEIVGHLKGKSINFLDPDLNW